MPSAVMSTLWSESRSRTSISGYLSWKSGMTGAISRLPSPSGAATRMRAARLARDSGDRGLGFVDRLQHLLGAAVEDRAVLGRLSCRVVRLNSRTPRCFSSSLMRSEATAGEMRMSRPAADMMPSSTTRTKMRDVVEIGHAQADDPSIFRQSVESARMILQAFARNAVSATPAPTIGREAQRMNEFAIFWDWLSFAVRWLHVITGIAWIGSSFYFVALDLGLRQRPGLPAGAFGEEWQVHGGGFYHIQKYLVAPAEMPEHLTWFKWEILRHLAVRLRDAVRRLLRRRRPVPDRSATCSTSPAWSAILISLASIGVGWLVYDLLCKSPLGNSDTGADAGALLRSWCSWPGATRSCSPAAPRFLHLGAFTATIMSANVFMVIIPNQKIVVADLIAGRKPDPKYGKIAKQRSLHNNYLTLPVLFLMLSNHYPLAFAHRVQLGHRLAGVHHRRADPALFQHRACAQGQPDTGPGWRRRSCSSSSSGCRPRRRC